MLVYLDSLVIIYFLDHDGHFQIRAANWIAEASAAGIVLAVSDLTRFECRVKPIRNKDSARLADFDGFFAQPDIQLVSLPAVVFDRAAEIRADFGFHAADSIHLAAAIEARCDQFLTNDVRLSRFTGINVEILP